MSDEHRFDVSGFMGNEVVRTPFLDSLARDAVVFDNAYSPYPEMCIRDSQCPRRVYGGRTVDFHTGKL